MNFLQKGFTSQSSALAMRPRPQSLTPRVRPPLRRVQQPRRYNSTGSKTESPKEGQLGDASSIHTNASPQPNASAAAAGAAGTPHAAVAVTRTRAFQEMIKAGPVGKFGRWYARMQNEGPYKTQFFSSIIIYLCGDLGAQLLFPSEEDVQAAQTQASTGTKEEDEKPPFGAGYNPWRTVRHLIIGAGSSIPTYKWFMFLHNNFNYSSKFLSILTKVCVQQICFTPVFNTYFFSMHSLLAGATFEETLERLKKALPVSITNSVKLWPAVTAFSFMYVPPEFRNVFSGGIAVCWQTYLSWLNQKAAREVREAEAALEASTSHSIAGSLLPAAGTA